VDRRHFPKEASGGSSQKKKGLEAGIATRKKKKGRASNGGRRKWNPTLIRSGGGKRHYGLRREANLKSECASKGLYLESEEKKHNGEED